VPRVFAAKWSSPVIGIEVGMRAPVSRGDVRQVIARNRPFTKQEAEETKQNRRREWEKILPISAHDEEPQMPCIVFIVMATSRRPSSLTAWALDGRVERPAMTN
jgi:hypothetical protein